MKKLTFLLFFIVISFFSIAQNTPTATPDNLKKIEWLTGTWNRLDMKPGRSGHERWVKISPQEWEGWGVSMRGSDTAFMEKLRIVVKDNLIFYVADVKGNKDVVYFKFTSLDDDHFVCENPDHDFPTKIEYHHKGNQLQASVSGPGKVIPYLFEKKNP